MRSMKSARARSSIGDSEDRAHRSRDGFPLPALGVGVTAALRRERVVFAGASILALAPGRLEEARSLHLMQGGVERAFLHLELTGAAPLCLLQDLISVHRALAEQRQNENADGAGQEFAVVIHLFGGGTGQRAGYLGRQSMMLCSARQGGVRPSTLQTM